MIRRTTLFALMIPSMALAADVKFEGAYRARARILSNLALDTDLQNQPAFSYVQHRLILRPTFLVSEDVALHVQIRALDGVVWGNQPVAQTTYGDLDSPVFDYDLSAPTDSGEDALLGDITLWRAWGDVNTQIGRFQFGRMPLHWGSGIWLNDGQTTGLDYADYGDTTDRFMWEYLFQDEFYFRLAGDLNTENYINSNDDKHSIHFASAYRNEDVTAGILLQLDRSPIRKFNLFTIDASADATVGPIQASAEFIGQFGSGDLENGANDTSISAFGGVIEAELTTEVIGLEVIGGFATGDKEDSDARYHTFTFDRDYSLGMFMFEQPMPTLAAANPNDVNNGFETDNALMGNAIRNAVFARVAANKEVLVPGLIGELSVFGSRIAAVPTRFEGRRSYGMEIDGTIRYTGVEHASFGLTFATFLPGSYIRNFADDQYNSFDNPAFGIQGSARIEF